MNVNALVRSELLKLATTRTVRFLVLGGLAVAARIGAGTAATAGQDGAAALGSPASIANVLGVSAMPGCVMLIAACC
ncbi:MAG: hypothetical protein ACRD2W_12115 [Acidimicrobiales bacterium]